jgi:hypothetical protein
MTDLVIVSWTLIGGPVAEPITPMRYFILSIS